MTNTAFPETGFVRLSQVLAPAGPIPVPKSKLWQGDKEGRFPQPQKLGPRTTVWKVEIVGSVLMHLSVGPYKANTVGFVIAFCVSFVGHKVFTFNAGISTAGDSFLRYFFLATSGYALHQILFFTLIAIVKTDPNFAMLVASVCVAGLTFGGVRFFVFRA